ncbi:MAG: hypothetical protein HKN50_06265 [Gammaproteobacteria bacterium]|nr:hypothetical protein [Gammaproteobacteria bacterium]
MPDKVYLQVFDPKVVNYPAVKCVVGGSEVCVVYDPDLVSGSSMHAAVFVDENALGNTIYRYPRAKRVCLLQESTTRGMHQHADYLARKFDLVLTFDERLLKMGPPFQQFFYGTSWINRGRPAPDVLFAKNRLCTFIANVEHNSDFGYELRKQVAVMLREDSRVDCWGRGIRPFEFKDDVLPGSYFSIAMENTRQDLYFSEKLIDCLVTDTVPLYWGPPSIGDVFDVRGMICFENIEQLQAEVKTLSVERYRSMLPYVEKNRMRAFELLLTGHETLVQRLAEQVLRSLPEKYKPLGPLARSRGAALLRKVKVF